ncbi:MAG: glycosyltransferase family 4 protein [Synechococcales cyanobacterium M58_A2018_015]|nr:glycosyltransferase family 4 protein [Synechococcales cyanobacterium M58_A2018_015]
MRIAFVPHPFSYHIPPHLGDSVAILTYETARCLARDHEVLIYNRGQRRFWKRPSSYNGIRYRYVWLTPDQWVQQLFGPLLQRFQPKQNPSVASWYYSLYALQVALDLQRQQCDIVHIHTYSQMVPIIRALNPAIKIVLHMHCEWLTQSDDAMMAERLRQTDLIIGCSRHITGKIQQRFPELAARCRTVYNGVDSDQFAPPPASSPATAVDHPPTLLFVGRVSPEKGVHVLLDAFREVVRQFPEARLELAGGIGALGFNAIVGVSDDPYVLKLAEFYQGDGDYYRQLKARIPTNLAAQVIFHGYVPHDQLIDLYRRADVLINPSLSEAFGMSLVESMATATPVIGARIGGMLDVIADGETGFLVEPANPDALAAAIITLLSQPSLRQQMGQRGRQRVLEQFSWPQIADSLLVHYRDLAGSSA